MVALALSASSMILMTFSPSPRSIAAGVDDGFGKGLRSLLRKVVSDAALDDPVLVLAGEFAGVGGSVRVRRAVGVSLQGDGGDGHGSPLCQEGHSPPG